MWLDIIVVIIVLVAAIIGMKRGFMLSMLTLCSMAVCLIAAGLLAYPASHIIVGMGASDRFQAVAIAFIILFILCFIGMLIIRGIVRLIHKLPVIKQLDTLGGLLVGLACGVVVISIFAVALHMFGDAQEIQPLLDVVDKSIVMKYFYQKNYVGLIMKAL